MIGIVDVVVEQVSKVELLQLELCRPFDVRSEELRWNSHVRVIPTPVGCMVLSGENFSEVLSDRAAFRRERGREGQGALSLSPMASPAQADGAHGQIERLAVRVNDGTASACSGLPRLRPSVVGLSRADRTSQGGRRN